MQTPAEGVSADKVSYLGQPFSQIYAKWCKDHGLTAESVTLKSGCKAFWIGDYKAAKYICVYYHGTLHSRLPNPKLKVSL